MAKLSSPPGSEPVAEPKSGLDRIHTLIASKLFLPTLAILIGSYYAFLITGGRFHFWTPAIRPGESEGSMLGFIFNDMLLRLLHGDFTSDPAIVKFEAVFWNGQIHAYFGVMPAFLRLLLLPFLDLTQIDVSRLSIWIAATLAVMFKVATLRILVSSRRGEPKNSLLVWALLAALLFAGAPMQFLRISVYQEAILWESVWASAFLAIAIAALVDDSGFTSRRLQWMALAAGLCLLTRVVLAIALYATIILLLGLLLHRTLRDRRTTSASRVSWHDFRAMLLGRFVLPVVILTIFAGAVGYVNEKRFGNPLVFHRPRQTLLVYPNGAPGMDNYGQFNIRRIPYTLMYYVAPVWFIHDKYGEFLFNGYKNREMDLVEAPPSSFLITDTLLLLLAIYGLLAIFRPRGLLVDRTATAAIACGLAIPVLLMLTAVSVAFRYRMEFYPLLEFLALIGAFAATNPLPAWTSRPKPVLALVMLAVLTSHILFLAYRASPGGSLDRSQSLRSIYFDAYKGRLGLGPKSAGP